MSSATELLKPHSYIDESLHIKQVVAWDDKASLFSISINYMKRQHSIQIHSQMAVGFAELDF